MKNTKIYNLCLKYIILKLKYSSKYNDVRVKQYSLLKEKHKKKINNFLYRFFNLKSNPNYIIESSLSSNIKIYKVISNKNIPVIEIEFIKDLDSKLFTNFQIRIQNSTTKDNDNLEKNVTLGKISKILLTKKDIILKKYNNYILSWEKNRDNVIYKRMIILSSKATKANKNYSFYRWKYIKNIVFTKNGLISSPSMNFNSQLTYPNSLDKIDTIKCKYLKNKKIEIIFISKECNKKYTYNISQEVFDELSLDILKSVNTIKDLDSNLNKDIKHFNK